MDCFLDFCLACDKQTTDGLYCSQACRLADLERAGSSAPVSPSAPGSIGHAGSHTSHSFGFFLSSNFDFGSSTSNTNSHDSSVSPNRQTATPKTRRERVLSPSTSRSSLASAVSNSSIAPTQAMSEEAQHELQAYVSSFDSIREMKRRSLSSNSGH